MEIVRLREGSCRRAETMLDVLPDDTSFQNGALVVGGCRVIDLADTYGTPLYVYDEETLRTQARRILAAFSPLHARVSFASKACSTLGVLRAFAEEGLQLDVVSAGELIAGERAGFPMERIHLHGNHKTDQELEEAVRRGIRAVVIDSREEISRLEAICEREGRELQVEIRVTLPIEVETHPHIRTSGHNSKFGLLRGSESEAEAFQRMRGNRWLRCVGVHTHLGSQIADAAVYGTAADELVRLAESLRSSGLPIEEVSVGGGWAVAYRPGDPVLAPEAVASALSSVFGGHTHLRPAVEPGRALVARSALAVYRVGSVKEIGDRRLLAVDGGMGDNPRPSLYGARYSALLAVAADAEPVGVADVVGRYCESGDVLVRGVPLPGVSPGDLVCVPVSGAYQLSMASAYNLVPPPAVVLVNGGRARLLTRRATVEDLLMREMAIDGQK